MHVRQTLLLISGGFALALAILLVIAGATSREWSSIDRRLYWVDHTQKVISTLDDLEIGLRNAGAAGRDYLMRPDPAYLQRFESGLHDYRVQIEKLEAQTRDNPRQQREVMVAAALIERKISAWRQLLAQRTSIESQGPWLVTAMRTMTISDLLDQVMSLRKAESRLLSQRIDESSDSIHTGRRFVLYGFVLCVGLLLGSFGFVIVQMRRRMRAESQLRSINNSLEERIAARTAALAQSNDNLRLEVQANARAREEIRQLNAGLEQRVHERTVQLESANKELESFSYSVSHDLRTPLRAIVGFSRMLRDRMASRLEAEDSRLLGVIVDNAGRMSVLIDDLLNFSRLGRTQLSRHEVDMQTLAEEVVQELRGEDGAESYPAAQVSCAGLPACYGDRALLGQVWRNLLSNAFKFSGGVERPLIRIEGSEDGEYCHYQVSDNGVGFDMRYYDKLFGVFQRLHTLDEFPGTGVGLAIVQRIIARHGGRVWAEAVPGQGATFHFTVSRIASRAEAPIQEPHA